MTQLSSRNMTATPSSHLTDEGSSPPQSDVDAEYEYHHGPADTLPPNSSGLYPQFILLGDSITQKGALDLLPNLQNSYIRRLDIVNRGFNGYTAPLALQTLPHFLPISTPSPSSKTPQIKLLTVFFGANDACIPGQAQHVPVDQYLLSLRKILTYPVFRRHNTKLILITPPPVDEHQLNKPLNRTAANVARYAAAAHYLATKDLHIPCLDLWSIFVNLANASKTKICRDHRHESESNGTNNVSTVEPSGQAGPYPGSSDLPPNPVLARLLVDGLHFTPYGYDVFFHHLMDLIRTDIPELMPEKLPLVFKDWKDVF